ncbi:hypothetical protein HMPREF1863_01318 [Aedoeadaptatus coxii]|uniref:Uncharacterized protein n=1 Tax=Aedoeadaptatus coxii TaxID=755172 RepID=A0A134ACZ2_9FIRM|nr:hypothetical protein HMPREF1863_01318 [Peptoniphilus coxii]
MPADIQLSGMVVSLVNALAAAGRIIIPVQAEYLAAKGLEQLLQCETQIQKYIRLTELIPELLNMGDEKKIAFNPAYELSFLKPEEQQVLLVAIDYKQATPFSLRPSALKSLAGMGNSPANPSCRLCRRKR